MAGNTKLSTDQVETLVYPFLGPGRTPADVEGARAALQAAYEKAGYASVSVSIPEQGVDSGVIRLEVAEQRVGKVVVAGGGKGTQAWVLKRAPSLASGSVPNFKAVQQDIVALNRAGDRKVTPEVKAGAAPGTVDVALNVEEHSALHGSTEVNNYASPSTSDLRVGASLRYDDLWGRGDSISVSGQVAPRRSQDGWVVSGNYLMQLGHGLQLLAYGVHSDSDIATVGGTDVVGKGDLAGVRLIVPLSQSAHFYQSFTIGIDYKDFQEDVLLGADRSTAPVRYFPVTLGWRGDWTAEHNKAYVSASMTAGNGLGDGVLAFNNKRLFARPDFVFGKLEAADTLDLPRGLQGFVKVTGQASLDPLVSNEQFSLGGSDTVRGYFESEVLGDYGVALESELRSPSFAPLLGSWVDEARFHVFADGGRAALWRATPGQVPGTTLISVGVGTRWKLVNHLNGAVDLAIPLKAGPDTDKGDPVARFRILGEF